MRAAVLACLGLQLLPVQGLHTASSQRPAANDLSFEPPETEPVDEVVADGVAQLSGGRAASAAQVNEQAESAEEETYTDIDGKPKKKKKGQSDQRPARDQWTYYPPQSRLAIVTGGQERLYQKGAWGSKNAEMLLNYCKKKGYGLFIDKNISAITARRSYWNKFGLLWRLNGEFPFIVWIDPDVVPARLDKSLYSMMMSSNCNEIGQSQWEKITPPHVTDNTFLWMSADTHQGGFDQYEVNVAPGVIGLRSGRMAQHFLEAAWHVGDNFTFFLKHHYALPKGHARDDWPYEMGGIWDALAAEPYKYLKNACISKAGYLQSVRDELWHPSMMFRNTRGMGEKAKNMASSVALWASGGDKEV